MHTRKEIMKISYYDLAALQRERSSLVSQGWSPRGKVCTLKGEYGLVYYQFMERPAKGTA